jgi:hypothetical protein
MPQAPFRSVVSAPLAALPALLLSGLLVGLLPAQQPKAPPAYPERDVLSPFRECTEICAPPDALFAQLRAMQSIADDPKSKHGFDEHGREVVDDSRWWAARKELEHLDLDAGYLAQILRTSRNSIERATAFYGAFYVANVDHVFNLIAHIPGEPERRTREQAYPRAIAFLRANLGRTWGDLTPEQRAAFHLPQPGSPAAKAQGITRAPRDSDPLHQLNLRPFFQLLDLDAADDQAQGLWFLKECFTVRADLALTWLEPALPRVRQLLVGDSPKVRAEAEGLLLAIGAPGQAGPPADADDAARVDWANKVQKRMFPPIRQLSDGLIVLLPGDERQAIVDGGKQALAGNSLGEPQFGRTKDGQPYRGLRLAAVPESLTVLKLPAGAVITAINGNPVGDLDSLRRVLGSQFEVSDGKGNKQPISRRSLMVEFVLDGAVKAIEYRVL